MISAKESNNYNNNKSDRENEKFGWLSARSFLSTLFHKKKTKQFFLRAYHKGIDEQKIIKQK